MSIPISHLIQSTVSLSFIPAVNVISELAYFTEFLVPKKESKLSKHLFIVSFLTHNLVIILQRFVLKKTGNSVDSSSLSLKVLPSEATAMAGLSQGSVVARLSQMRKLGQRKEPRSHNH